MNHENKLNMAWWQARACCQTDGRRPWNYYRNGPRLALQHLTGFSLRALRVLAVLRERRAAGLHRSSGAPARLSVPLWKRKPWAAGCLPRGATAPSATSQVSSGSRCLGAAVQVSSSTKPPVQQISRTSDAFVATWERFFFNLIFLSTPV